MDARASIVAMRSVGADDVPIFQRTLSQVVHPVRSGEEEDKAAPLLNQGRRRTNRPTLRGAL